MSAVQPNPADRLALLIEGLCAAIAARGAVGALTAALQCLIWGRLKRTAARVRRLAVRIAGGQPLAAPRRRAPEPSRPGRPPPPRLPRGYAWLVRLVPASAAGAAGLQALLSEPEMAALAQAPPMRRLLRPLCQMLGVPPPPIPKRPAATPAPAPSPPPTARHTQPGPFSATPRPRLPPALGVASGRGSELSRVEDGICPA
jgi:hypothetical protein